MASETYTLCPEFELKVASIKLFEDKLFYERINNWQEYIDYLKDILPEEINCGVAETDIRHWHTLLQKLFQQPPNDQTRTEFNQALGFDNQVSEELNHNISLFKENPDIVDILENLYNNFDQILLDHH